MFHNGIEVDESFLSEDEDCIIVKLGVHQFVSLDLDISKCFKKCVIIEGTTSYRHTSGNKIETTTCCR